MSIFTDAFKLKPAAAISYLKDKGYAFSWNWFDTWREAHTQAFTVAKVTRLDILQDIRGAVSEALNEGITFQQFKKELAPRLQQKGWWGKKELIDEVTGEITEIQLGSVRRLRTIYQTNLQTAYMAGRQKQQAAVADSRPYLQYISIIDQNTTDRCRSLNLSVYPADDPVWDHLYPPNHWGCRARVRSLSERQIERYGLSPSSSEGKLVTRTVTVGKGDEARDVEVTGLKLSADNTYWPDPGWDYNPGKAAFKPDLSKYDSDLQSQFKRDS